MPALTPESGQRHTDSPALLRRMFLTRFDLWVLAWILISRIVLILLVAPDQSRMFNGDSPQYDCLAQTLVESGAYECPDVAEFSSVLRPPGYPLIIAACYAVFGAGGWLAAICLNIPALMLLYIGLLRLLQAAGAPAASRWAALFIVSEPLVLLYSKELVPEPIFTALLTWSAVLVLRSDGGLKQLVFGAILLGMATLVKPVSLYLVILWALFVLWQRRSLPAPILLAAVFGAVIAPWLLFVHSKTDSWTFTSTQSKNLGVGHTSYVRAEVEGLTYFEAHIAVQEEIERRAQRLPVRDYKSMDSLWAAYAGEYLSAHPFIYAKTILKGMAITILDPGRLVLKRTLHGDDNSELGLTNIIATEGLWGAFTRLFTQEPVMAVVLLFNLLLMGLLTLAVLAGLKTFWLRNRTVLIFTGLTLMYLWVLGGPNGYARFRLYLMPFLLVIASYGVEWLLSRRRGSEKSV